MSYIPTGASRQLSRATVARRSLTRPRLATKQVVARVASTPTKAPPPPPLPSSPRPGSSLSAKSSVTSQPVSAELPAVKTMIPFTPAAIPTPSPAPAPTTMEPAPAAVVTPTPGPTRVISTAPSSPSSFSSGGGAAWGGGAAAAIPFDIPEEMLEPGSPLPLPAQVPWKLVGLGLAGATAAWFAWKKWGKK